MMRIEDIASSGDFLHLNTVVGVRHDLRYASSNNFAGRRLYGTLDCAWLRREAATGLEAAARWLHSQRPGWCILVLDALRPQRVQQAIWLDVAGTPAQEYFANPKRGSIHSYGMAVDVTLLDALGQELNMGSGFDEMNEKSHPALHSQLLQQGLITAEHVALRELLAGAMAAGGFSGISNEWWHFDHGNRDDVRARLPRIE
jgi:zinc D-Ala-D-Ala dipeptidase